MPIVSDDARELFSIAFVLNLRGGFRIRIELARSFFAFCIELAGLVSHSY